MGNRTPSVNRSGFGGLLVKLIRHLVKLCYFFPVVGEGLLTGELRAVGAVEVILSAPTFNCVFRGGSHKSCFLFH